MGMPTSGGNVNEREMKSESLAVRAEPQKVQEPVKQERTGWIEDEVEEPERWDGME
jgi:hypothetical protein